MAKPAPKLTIGDRLFWCYANLAMAEYAVHHREPKFGKKHFIIRSRLYSGLTKGTMSPRSLMRDQRIRMTLPQECIYCGSTAALAVDHIVPRNRGGDDSGDNAVWACRKCNSSKLDHDLFSWWFRNRPGFPPLFVVRVYLKQAMIYFGERQLMGRLWTDEAGHPFSVADVPEDYPQPSELIFAPFYSRKATDASREAAPSQTVASKTDRPGPSSSAVASLG